MMNPLQQAIYEKVVRPEINKLSFDTDGVVVNVDYYHQSVEIQWKDARTNEAMFASGVSIPQDGDGIYRQSLKVGDKIKVGFRQGDHAQPYVAMVYRKQSRQNDYFVKSGSGIPRGIAF